MWLLPFVLLPSMAHAATRITTRIRPESFKHSLTEKPEANERNVYILSNNPKNMSETFAGFAADVASHPVPHNNAHFIYEESSSAPRSAQRAYMRSQPKELLSQMSSMQQIQDGGVPLNAQTQRSTCPITNNAHQRAIQSIHHPTRSPYQVFSTPFIHTPAMAGVMAYKLAENPLPVVESHTDIKPFRYMINTPNDFELENGTPGTERFRQTNKRKIEEGQKGDHTTEVPISRKSSNVKYISNKPYLEYTDNPAPVYIMASEDTNSRGAARIPGRRAQVEVDGKKYFVKKDLGPQSVYEEDIKLTENGNLVHIRHMPSHTVQELYDSHQPVDLPDYKKITSIPFDIEDSQRTLGKKSNDSKKEKVYVMLPMPVKQAYPVLYYPQNMQVRSVSYQGQKGGRHSGNHRNHHGNKGHHSGYSGYYRAYSADDPEMAERQIQINDNESIPSDMLYEYVDNEVVEEVSPRILAKQASQDGESKKYQEDAFAQPNDIPNYVPQLLTKPRFNQFHYSPPRSYYVVNSSGASNKPGGRRLEIDQIVAPTETTYQVPGERAESSKQLPETYYM